jgi:hypothetical protein
MHLLERGRLPGARLGVFMSFDHPMMQQSSLNDAGECVQCHPATPLTPQGQ